MQQITHAYLGRNASGEAVAFVVDRPSNAGEVRKTVLELFDDGLTVERLLYDDALRAIRGDGNAKE